MYGRLRACVVSGALLMATVTLVPVSATTGYSAGFPDPAEIGFHHAALMYGGPDRSLNTVQRMVAHRRDGFPDSSAISTTFGNRITGGITAGAVRIPGCHAPVFGSMRIGRRSGLRPVPDRLPKTGAWHPGADPRGVQ